MNENNLNILKTCDEIANNLHSLKIAQMTKEARETVTNDRKVNIVFIGQSLPLLIRTVQSILEIEMLSSQSFSYVERACKLIFSYDENGESSASMDGTTIGFNALEIIERIKDIEDNTIPQIRICLGTEVLKHQDITILYSYNEFIEYNWKKEFNYCEFAFLITNATAAMNLKERNFIDSCVKRLLGATRFGIVICNLELLNTEADINAVLGGIRSYRTGSNLDCKIFEANADELKEFVCTTMVSNIAELREMAINQSLINCIAEVEETIRTIEENAELDLKEIEELIQEFEKRKNKVETSGKIAASTISGSFSAKIKYELTNDINKYSEDAIKNILKAVETSTDIEATKRKIPKYLEDIWTNFELEQGKKLKTDTQALIDKIYCKMEQDVGDFLTDFSESKRKVLEYAMTNISIDGGIIDYDAKESSTEKKINKISKIMLWSAIPVALLTNLPLGIATAVGSKVIKKFTQKTIDTENKEVIMNEIKLICNTTKNEMLNHANSSINNVVNEVELEIIDSYKNFVETILLELNHMRDKAVEAEKMVDSINDIKTNILPAMKGKIN